MRFTLRYLAVIVAAALTACADHPTMPAHDAPGEFVISANVYGTPIATLAIIVTASDIAPPLAFNITQSGGTASGTIKIPPGSARTITIYAFNAAGDTTHDGSRTIDVRPGQNALVSMALVSRAGHVPINVVLGPVNILITGGLSPLVPGETVQLTATLTAPDGFPIAQSPQWASTNPAAFTVSATGLVNAVGDGSGLVVATYAGVAAWTSVSVVAFAQVAGGQSHSCGVTTGGNAFCWGHNSDGQLGDNTNNPRLKATVPVYSADLPAGTRFTRVAAGATHSCALAQSGDIWCWGRNASGQLGNNSNNSSAKPVLVQSSRKFIAVTAGATYTCALDLSGFAWCWGASDEGQTGHGANNTVFVPTAVDGGRTFRDISASPGSSTTCATGTDFHVYCWGYNANGQLGNGSNNSSFVPTQVAMPDPSRKYLAVSSGGRHSCAVSDDGRAICWGDNDHGELSGSVGGGRSTPTTEVVTLSGITAIAAGMHHSCALTASGLFCWGDGLASGFGSDTGTPANVAPDPSGVIAFTGLSAGTQHTMLASSARHVYGWGTNPDGRVGNGTATDQPATNPLPRVQVR